MLKEIKNIVFSNLDKPNCREVSTLEVEVKYDVSKSKAKELVQEAFEYWSDLFE